MLEENQEPEPEAVAPEPHPDDMSVGERANLARFYDPEDAKKLAAKCCDRHQRDVGNRAPRMKRLKDIQDMYALITKQKNFPFQNCANIRTPAVTAPVLQISARLFDMTWPASGKVFNVVAANSTDMEYAQVTEAFANSYVRYNIPYMATSLADTIHQKCLYGSAFRRTYWDAYTARVRSDRISIDDFVVPFAARSSDPSMADVPHYTWLMHMTLDEIQDLAADKLFVNSDLVKPGQRAEGTGSSFSETTRKIEGVSPDTDAEDFQREVIEQHFRMKLPDDPATHPAFDGKSHYVYAVIDVASEALLRLCVREEDDPDDKRRHDREAAKIDQYVAQMEQYKAEMAAQAMQALQPQGPPDIAGPPGLEMAPPQMAAPPPQPPQMPEAPFGLDETGQPKLPKPIRRRQITFFTHYRCFPSEGFYGLGYGDLIYGLAVALNTVINQSLDGTTLKNSKPAFMSNQLRMQRGSVNVQPGEIVAVDGPVSQIRDAIMFLDPPGNDPATVPLIQMLDGMKDAMVGSADLMAGEIPGSNQTKAGMQILQSEMMTPITVLARQTREELKHDLDKIWRCLGVFLDDEDITEFLNVETGKPQQAQLGKWMFTPTVHLVPASDPRAKQQRIEDFSQLFGFCMNNPFVQQGPAALPIMRAMTELGFKMFPEGEKLIPLLPEIPTGPPPPPPPKPQWAENAGFLRGEDSQVHPDDNDDEHVAMTMQFMQSPEGSAMDPTGRAMAEKHVRSHLAAKIEKQGAQFEQFRSQLAGPNGAGASPMAGGPGVTAPNPPPPV